jgi:hypothetical protein
MPRRLLTIARIPQRVLNSSQSPENAAIAYEPPTTRETSITAHAATAGRTPCLQLRRPPSAARLGKNPLLTRRIRPVNLTV